MAAMQLSRHTLASSAARGCPAHISTGASVGARGLHSPHARAQVKAHVAAPAATATQQQQQRQQQQQALSEEPIESSSHFDGSASAEVLSTDGLGSLVRFKAYFTAQFGDTVKVVGSAPELGAWDPTQALALNWTEGGLEQGDLWTADVQLAAGDCDFKMVVQTAVDVLWEPGENRAMQVHELEPSEVLVTELVYGKQELMAPPVVAEVAALAEAGQVTEAAGAAEVFEEHSTVETATAASPAQLVSQDEEQATEATEAAAFEEAASADMADATTHADLTAGAAVEAIDAAEVAQEADDATDAQAVLQGSAASFEDNAESQAALKEQVVKRAEAELEQHTQAISVAAAVAAAAAAPGAPAAASSADLKANDVAASEEAPVPIAATSAAAGSAAAAAPAATGGAELVGALLGTAAVATVLYSEFVLKQTGCGLPPGPNGLIGAAEGISYLAVVALAGAGTVRRAQGRGGLPGPLVLPEVLSYVAIAVGAVVLYLQVQDHGYVPPVLPGGACYADSAATSLPSMPPLPSLPSFSLPSLTAPGV